MEKRYVIEIIGNREKSYCVKTLFSGSVLIPYTSNGRWYVFDSLEKAVNAAKQAGLVIDKVGSHYQII